MKEFIIKKLNDVQIQENLLEVREKRFKDDFNKLEFEEKEIYSKLEIEFLESNKEALQLNDLSKNENRFNDSLDMNAICKILSFFNKFFIFF